MIYRMVYPLIVNLLMSVVAFFLTIKIIPRMKPLFVKAGLAGKDMNKKNNEELMWVELLMAFQNNLLRMQVDCLNRCLLHFDRELLSERINSLVCAFLAMVILTDQITQSRSCDHLILMLSQKTVQCQNEIPLALCNVHTFAHIHVLVNTCTHTCAHISVIKYH